MKQSDVDKKLGTQMSSHYFGNSQWAFPTREEYNKMKEFMPLKPYDKVYGYFDLLQSLQSLESLEKLQSLERLERLQRLQRLETTCGDYKEYEYKQGDVIYCDSPYENTNEYNIKFDSQEFYDWVASRPYRVFFSSYNINGFYVVDSVKKRQLLSAQESKLMRFYIVINHLKKRNN